MARGFPWLVVATSCGFLLTIGCGPGVENSSVNATPGSKKLDTAGNLDPKPAEKKLEPPKKKAITVQGDRLANFAPMPANPQIPQEPSPFRFAEIAAEAGVDFVHYSGMNEEKHFPTANGSGVAMFDYDGDGLLDLYFASATLLPLGSVEKGPNRLFKNLGGNKFRDVTAAAGVGFRGFCHGAIAGDIDNDGDQDLFLCNYGPNVLYRNEGNGKFTDISKAAGVARDGWSSSGAFIDYDSDGDLDLYVSNYGEWKLPEDNAFCGDSAQNVRLYCSPRSVRTVKHFFYRNNGNGTFTDVYDSFLVDSKGAKIPGRADGHGFGIVTADFDGDGKTDIYVANDMNPNYLFINKGGGLFEDATEASGASYDEKGNAQSGMGVDAEDLDGDGDPELFVTNFANEYNTLYTNLGKASFMDLTAMNGLAADSMPWVGWGTALADFDSDGWPDIFVANGHVDDNREKLGQNVEYVQPPLLHRNQNGKRFKLSTRDVGTYFSTKHVARGSAYGDIDNDGDIDLVVNHKDRPAALLRNDTKTTNHWVRLELTGTKSNRDALGALVKIELGPRKIFRQRKGGCSLQATNDPRITVGLGDAKKIDRLTVRWPSGLETVLDNLEVDRAHKIVEPKP